MLPVPSSTWRLFRNESPHLRVERTDVVEVEELAPIKPGSIPDQVLTLLTKRPMRVAEIHVAIGRTYGTATDAVQRLRRRGLIKKGGQCQWRVA
jgi:predicted DNA-binding transcriptional regulator